MREENHWTRLQQKQVSRRSLIKGAAIGAAGLAGLTLGGCGDRARTASPPTAQAGTSPAAGKIKTGGTLRLSTLSSFGEPTTFYPIANASWGATNLLSLPIYDRLFEYDADFNLIPGGGLVASFEHLEPLIYTLRLQQGVTFHDGTPFNARAVAMHLDRAKNDPASVAKSDVAPLERVETPDDSTVVLKLSRGAGELPLTLAGRTGCIVSPTAVEKYGKDIGRNPAGTGPFMLKEWIPGTKWTLVKNPNYRRKGLPYLDRLEYTVIADDQAVSTGLRSKEIDALSGLGALAGQFDVLKGASNLVAQERTGMQFWLMLMNGTKPPFNNRALAQAISYAVDREEIVKVASFGRGWTAQGFIPKGHPYFDPNFQPYPPKGDPTMAKQKLAEGGMPSGFEFVIDTADSGAYLRVTQAVQAQLAKVGIKATIRQGDAVTQNQRIFTLDMDAVLLQWAGRASQFETASSLLHKSGAYQTKERTANSQIDELVERAGNAVDPNEAKRLFQELQRAAAEDARNPALGAGNVLGYHQKDVRDYVLFADQATRLTNVWADR